MAANWSGGSVPGSLTNAAISAPGTYSVLIDAPASTSTLTLNDAGATVIDSGALVLGTQMSITAGTFEVAQGGTVSGKIAVGSGGTFVVHAGSTLSAVKLSGLLTVDDNVTTYQSSAFLSGGFTLAGGTIDLSTDTTGSASGSLNVLSLADASTTLNNGTLIIGSNVSDDTLATTSRNGDLMLGSKLTVVEKGGLFLIQANGTLTNASNLVINQANSSAKGGYASSLFGGSLVNSGTISVTGAGVQASIEGNNLSLNSGLLSVSNGALARWTFLSDNTGKVTVSSGGTLQIGAPVAGSTTFIPTFTDTGSIDVNGGLLVDYDLNTWSGTTRVENGGTVALTHGIAGGTFTSNGGNGVVAYTGSGGTLSNLTIGKGVTLVTSTSVDTPVELDHSSIAGTLSVVGQPPSSVAQINIGSGVTFAKGSTLTASIATVNLLGSQTFDNMTLNLGQNATLQANTDSGTITLGAGLTLNVTGLTAQIVALGTDGPPALQSTVVNNASITVGSYGLSVTSAYFVNNGVLGAANGQTVGEEAYLGGTNTGTLVAQTGGTLWVYDSLTNNKLIEANGGNVVLDTTGYGTVTNNGTILATGGGQVTFNDTPTNSASNTLTGGTWAVNASSVLQLSAGADITTLNASVSLAGAGSVLEWSDGGSLTTLDQSLTAIGGLGTLSIGAGRTFAAANALTNQGSILLAGGTLTASAIANGGTISGAGTLGATVSGGTEIAAKGTLALTGAVQSGTLGVGAGATLSLGNSVAAGVQADFLGTKATLAIASLSQFAGTIGGLVAGDTIDVSNLMLKSAAFVGSNIVLGTTGGPVSIALSAPVSGLALTTKADGHGGTDVIVKAAVAAITPLDYHAGVTVDAGLSALSPASALESGGAWAATGSEPAATLGSLLHGQLGLTHA